MSRKPRPEVPESTEWDELQWKRQRVTFEQLPGVES